MSLNEQIKRCRQEKNISQRELGRRINKTGQLISSIERGETTPSMDTITKIATALEVPLSQLINSMNFDTVYKINPNADFTSIKKYRQEMKISQEELSELIGIKLEDLKGIEAGTISNPRIDYAVKLNSFFKPTPPFCLSEKICDPLFEGSEILQKSYNEILKDDIYQINNFKLDKKTILKEYIKVFSKNKNVDLEPSEIKNTLDFLLATMDPLLEYKINEILKYRENNK